VWGEESLGRTTDSEDGFAIGHDDEVDQTGRVRPLSEGGQVGLFLQRFDVGFQLSPHAVLVREALRASGGIVRISCQIQIGMMRIPLSRLRVLTMKQPRGRLNR
jgi:hypothetical protein